MSRPRLLDRQALALAAARSDLIMVRLSGSPDGGGELDYTVNCAVGYPLVTGSGSERPVNHVLPETMVEQQLTLPARENDAGRRCDIAAGMAKLLAARVA